MSTATQNRMMISGVFRDRSRATQAYTWLRNRGYTADDINVLMSAETSKYFADNDHRIKPGDHGLEGVATGGAIGTIVGATLGAIAAMGTSVIVPGLGIVVAGPILAGLAAGGAGAVTGGLLGGLIGLGIPESNARAYEKILKDGGVVIGVTPFDDDEDAIRELFAELEADNVVTVKN